MSAITTDPPRHAGDESVPLLGSGKPSVPPADGARLRPIALAALTLALIGLCVLLSVPFLPALAWGAALAIIASPLHAWLSAGPGGPRRRRAPPRPSWSS